MSGFFSLLQLVNLAITFVLATAKKLYEFEKLENGFRLSYN